eukprot:m.14312 g.14312  ORF g.14312 m.14312 type:complete len:100 (-) comp4774_c0_seq1:284-583(-)
MATSLNKINWGIDVSLSPLGNPARDQLGRDVELLRGRVTQVIADANAARAAHVPPLPKLTTIYIGVTGVSKPALAGGAVTSYLESWIPKRGSNTALDGR